MKAVMMKKAVTLLVIGMLFVLLGTFFKITKIGTDIVYTTAITIGIIAEITAIYLIIRHFMSLKKERK